MFRDNEVAFVYMYTKPVDAAKLIPAKRGSGECGVVRYGGTGYRIAAALEISDSASPRRASGLLNVGGRAENKS